MEITSMIRVNNDINIELECNSDNISIITRENPSLIQEDDEIYLGDNPDIYGLYIGKDNPLLEKVLDLIYEN